MEVRFINRNRGKKMAVEKIQETAVARAALVIAVTPEELEDQARRLRALATNGETLPGQMVTQFLTSSILMMYDPQLSKKKFEGGSVSRG